MGHPSHPCLAVLIGHDNTIVNVRSHDSRQLHASTTSLQW